MRFYVPLFPFLLFWIISSGCSRTQAGTGATASLTPAAVQTAAGADQKASPAILRDISMQAGVNFTLGHNGRSPLTILETLGGGGAFLDYDGDGKLDILLVGPNKIALYHNNGNGTFTDVTGESGLRQDGEWQGVAVGDYDNDGKPDVFITGYRTCALYHNEGGMEGKKGEKQGKNGDVAPQQTSSFPSIPLHSPFFRDVTDRAGVRSKLWGASACWLDIDNDGKLDLYVTHYVKFFPNSTQYCMQTGVKAACGPTNYDPEIGTLYHNNGNGTFTDETKKRGLATAHGNALGVAAADYDGDGWTDIAVANDQQPGDLFRNKGHGFFENVGLISGTAYDSTGAAHAGMGIDWADTKADGKLALIVTTYQHQPKSLYTQIGPGLFTDASSDAGLAQPTLNSVGFGAKFFDYDNDGLPDLIIANGHAVDNIHRTDSTTDYAQLPQLFHNLGSGKFAEVSSEAGPDFRKPIVGRGLAVGDFDNDGKMDALVMDIEGRTLLLHNEQQNANHWLTLTLEGTRSPRDGTGAQITITANGRTWQQTVTSGGSFLSASDIRAHIGLGSATQAERIAIRWPSGIRTVLTNVAADRFLTVRE